MSYQYIVINGFIALFSAHILKEYLDIFLNRKEKRSRYVNGLYAIYILFQIYHDVTERLSPLAILILSMVIACCICMAAYQDSVRRNVIIVVLLHVIWMICEITVAYVFLIFGIGYESVALVGSVISKLIMFTGAEIIKRCKKPRIATEVAVGYWIVLLFIPNSSIYLLHNIFRISHSNEKDLVFAFISSVLIVLINYIIFKVYEKLEKEFELQKQNELFYQQLEAYNRELAERECYMQETRKIKHDIKHHLICLKGLMEKEHIQESIDYIEELMNKEVSREEEIIKSGNITIDSLLNYKHQVAKKQGIEFHVEVLVPDSLPYENRDICVLLGNSLDNAIEAAVKVREKPFVKASIIHTKGTLSIVIKNSYNGMIKKSGEGMIQTIKEDSKAHGIGLLSIRNVAEKYNGGVHIETGPDIFFLKILLYDREKVTS